MMATIPHLSSSVCGKLIMESLLIVSRIFCGMNEREFIVENPLENIFQIYQHERTITSKKITSSENPFIMEGISHGRM